LIKLKENPYSIEFVKKQVNDAKFDFTISDIAFYPFSFINNLKINNAYNIIK
jgi:DNA-dependent RNA polymerase auxiliary subunit epsilon